MIKRLFEKLKTLRLYFVIKSKSLSKQKIKLLRESILLYNSYGSPNIVDLGRKHSIYCIYCDLSLKYAIYESYSL